MLWKECKQYEVEGKGFVNQPDDTCFKCWFKRDIVSNDDVKHSLNEVTSPIQISGRMN